MVLLIGQPRTTGCMERLRGGRFKTEMRRNYSQRVVNFWNSLPHSTVESESLNGIKKESDIFLIKKRRGDIGTGSEVDLRPGRDQS